VSKGAAAFTLCAILIKVFAPMVEYWTYMLAMIVIVLSITVANLFAIRQDEFKRFMAFSSISQAGYIMLAVLGDSAMGVTALSYYVLIYVVANLAVFSIISSVEEHNNGVVSMDAYNGFYKTNPKSGFPHDAGFVLPGWYSSIRRNVLEILRVHGRCQAR
jgi:NADH-quinone oxidoreductase subunit N